MIVYVKGRDLNFFIIQAMSAIIAVTRAPIPIIIICKISFDEISLRMRLLKKT